MLGKALFPIDMALLSGTLYLEVQDLSSRLVCNSERILHNIVSIFIVKHLYKTVVCWTEYTNTHNLI